MNRLRLLVLSPVPYEGAGCRFRIAQYIPYLASQGIDVTIAPFYDREFLELVYRPGHHALKAAMFLKSMALRVAAVLRSARYDATFIYREAMPVGPPVLEAVLRAFGRPLVFDFDDAVFLLNTSEANRRIAALLKRPNKTGWIISRCEEVIAGNDFLGAYARRFNESVHVIPTSVDTTVFTPSSTSRPRGARLVVGWIGTPTTATYLAALHEPLAALAQQMPFVFRVSGAGPGNDVVRFAGVEIETPAWSLEREVELFSTCDIGVYPMPDDDWAKGKCGFKAIQFMACGVPVVASAVGVNRDIIQEGVNGFLAETPADWQRAIGRLLGDPALRRSIGDAGRRTVEQRYSLHVNAPRVAAVIRQAAERRRIAEPVASAAGDHR